MWSALATVVTIIAGGAGMVWVARINARSNSRTATTPPYDKLAARVSELEDRDEEHSKVSSMLRTQLDVVIRDRDALVRYVTELSAWFHGGQKPPAPTMPVTLQDHLAPDAFEHARITSRTTTTTTQYSDNRNTPRHDDESGE